MGRSRDEFSCHIVPVKVRCKYCEHEFTYNATRLKEHLANASSGEIIDCVNVPLDVKEAAKEAIGGAKKSVESMPSSSHVSESRNSVHIEFDQDISYMGRSRDEFLCHIVLGKVRCKYCEHEFTYNATRLKEHLANARSGEIIDCAKVPSDVKKETIEAIGGAKKRVKSISSSSHVSKKGKASSASLTSISTISDCPHASKELCISNNMSREAVDKELSRCFLRNSIPFVVAQTTSFKSLVIKLATHGPGYELPSCQELIGLVPELKMEVESHSTSVQKSWDETGCTLVFIFRKDGRGGRCLHICAYAHEGLVFVDQMDITIKSKKEVKEFICSVVERIGPHHIVQFITNAETLKSSFEDELASKFPHVYWTSCAARRIHSLLNDIYEQVEWVKKAMDDASQIALCIHQHNGILLLMKKRANGKELKQPCRNIVASLFSTLHSISDVEHELKSLVASSEWKDISNEMANEIANIILDGDFWSQAKDVLKALCPIVRVLRLVESDRSTSGCLYQAMDMAKGEIKEQYENNKEKYERILDLFVNNYFKKIIHPIHEVAASLNPGYMFMMDEQKMSSALDKVVASADRDAFKSEISVYHGLKREIFFTDPSKSNSWAWWNLRKKFRPVSSKYAMRILPQPCSSFSSEQLNWSIFEPTQSQKSNCPDFADVGMKLMMMEKSNLMTKNANEPFSFDQLSELSDYIDFDEDDPSHIWDELWDDYSLEYLSSILY